MLPVAIFGVLGTKPHCCFRCFPTRHFSRKSHLLQHIDAIHSGKKCVIPYFLRDNACYVNWHLRPQMRLVRCMFFVWWKLKPRVLDLEEYGVHYKFVGWHDLFNDPWRRCPRICANSGSKNNRFSNARFSIDTSALEGEGVPRPSWLGGGDSICKNAQIFRSRRWKRTPTLRMTKTHSCAWSS